MNFRNKIFIFAHNFYDRKFKKFYDYYMDNQWKSFEVLRQQQEERLNRIARHSYENVEYYHKLFIDYGINVNNFGFKELQKLPLLTKDIINANWNKFTSSNIKKAHYTIGSTGGTTGTPLRYRISKRHRLLSGILIYRAWNMGGYELSDSMVMLGGASIASKSKFEIINMLHEQTRNIRKLSSFDMSELEMAEYFQVINKFKPKFIRGYPSAIYFFAKWLKDNNKNYWTPKAVFTTSEKLFPKMRKTISEVFNCEVFDGYGLNDGGIQAHECKEHNGMHIFTENAVTEIYDDNKFSKTGEGTLIATSLNNFAFPFLRYDTGDRAIIKKEKCKCGRDTQIIKEITGRSVDVLKTPSGKLIHGWFFLYIFWEYDKGIDKYQVVQKSLDLIHIKLIINSEFKKELMNEIKNLVHKRAPEWQLNFEIVKKIEPTKNGKFKFIVSEISE